MMKMVDRKGDTPVSSRARADFCFSELIGTEDDIHALEFLRVSLATVSLSDAPGARGASSEPARHGSKSGACVRAGSLRSLPAYAQERPWCRGWECARG